jgi:hopanoid biosynthesis associated protein HpnK
VLARERPRLGVGLHLTFLFGHSALPADRIPDLVNDKGEFSNSPAFSGMKFFFKPGIRAQLREEIRAQFERFRATGLELDHVNGHLHLHLHPAVLTILLQEASALGIRQMRLTRDPLSASLRLQSGNWAYRLSHTLIFSLLSARAEKRFKQRGIRHTNHVFGLLSNAAVNESYVERLLPLLPAGDSELYSHPSLHEFRHEYDALVSPRVHQAVSQLGIQLIRYQDL